MIAMKALLIVSVFWLSLSAAHAESVNVKYRGVVDLAPFSCEEVTRSSIVNRVCYDQANSYMLIQLNGTFYHYCMIGADVVNGMLSASSMGRFFGAYIKGRYDCRLGGVPE